MATVSHWSTSWEGPLLHPGQEHYWWLVRSDWDERSLIGLDMQVNITAHPWVFGPYTPLPPVELTVKDVRSHITAAYKRVLYFTIRNSGANAVRVYGVGVSFIDE